jgi:hypothetical protein
MFSHGLKADFFLAQSKSSLFRSIKHSSTEKHLGCLPVVAIMNKVVIGIHMKISMCTEVYKPCMIAESHGKNMFSFVRNYQIVFPFAFHFAHALLLSPAMNEFLLTPHSSQHLILSVSWMLVIPVGI